MPRKTNLLEHGGGRRGGDLRAAKARMKNLGEHGRRARAAPATREGRGVASVTNSKFQWNEESDGAPIVGDGKRFELSPQGYPLGQRCLVVVVRFDPWSHGLGHFLGPLFCPCQLVLD